MVDNSQSNSGRARRISRIVHLVVAVVSASLAVYWLAKWLRGDADQYPNEILGGLTLTTAMAFLASTELVSAGRTRWTLAGIGTAILVISMAVIFGDMHMSPFVVGALLLAVAGIVNTARVFWPARGGSWAALRTTPATLGQRQAACTSMATLNLAFAVFIASRLDLSRGPWEANAVIAFTTLMFLGGAVVFLMLRLRLRG